ncbi:MAG: hypothetical protein CM15mP93_12040 [Thiotrichaceae bacterium]|nr:MAG: hypothetical protein CM15mP93_12040 [Thiotrichaceae bacterium]
MTEEQVTYLLGQPITKIYLINQDGAMLLFKASSK